MGVREVPGVLSSERIIFYHSFTKLKATQDETPWCSSFACAMVELSGVPSPKSARAIDWLSWGIPVDKPTLGCVVVLTRGTTTTNGHVGFYTGEDANHVLVLGGNQKDSVCESLFPKVAIRGFRLPSKEYWDPSSGGKHESNTSYS